MMVNKNIFIKCLGQIRKLLTVNRYYKMSNKQLEIEAHKWNIKGYGDPESGSVIRPIIIDALIKKDKVNDSRLAIFISILALIMGIIALLT